MYRYLIFLLVVSCGFSACTQENSKKPLEYRAEIFTGKWMAGEFITDEGRFFLAGQHGSIAYSSDGKNWLPSQTPVTDTLHDIAINSEQKTMLAVGDAGTILRSDDGGKSWQKSRLNLPASVDFSNTRLNTAIYQPQLKVWVVAGTQNAILHSADDGINWDLKSFNTGEDQQEILELFVERESGDVFFAAQYGTIGRSSDGGLNWDISSHDMQAEGAYIPHIVSFYQFEKVLIATGDEGRLLISKDAGATWTLIQVPTGGYFSGSAYDPKHNVIALTTQMGEVAISTDDGDTWKLVTFDVMNWPSDDIPFLSNIIYDKISQSFVLVGNSGVIARSVDGGYTWTADIFKPLFNMSVTTVLHNPTKNIFVAAGLGGVIVSSDTLGAPGNPLENWQVVRPGVDQYIREVINLPDSNIFVAVGQLGGIWRSEDDGVNWQTIDVVYPFQNQPPHLRDLAYDKEASALIAVGPAGSIMRSTDQGQTWKSVFQGEIHKGEAFTQILYDAKNKAYLASEVLYRSVYQSTDAGLSWNKIATIDSGERNLWHGAVSEKLSLMMVLGQKGGIAISRDGGLNWVMADTNIYNDLYGAYADNNDELLLAVGENGMILRSENGTDWQTVDSGTASTLRRVFKDPQSTALIAFGQQGTIVRSSDAGRSWSKVETPVNAGELRHALLESGTGNLIIVGKDGAILRSDDGGLGWQKLESHTSLHFRSAATNPQTGTIVVVGDGLVRLARSN